MSDGRNPSLPRVREADHPSAQGARRGYVVHTFKQLFTSAGAAQVVKEQEFTCPLQTHLQVWELNGSDSISVKLDVPGATWIQLEEGDVISREFNKFWVRSNSRFGDAANSFRTIGGPCEATIITSDGPMLLRAPKKYGMRAGFFTVGGTATAAGVDAFAGFATQYAALFPKGLPAFGKYGGMIYIKNRDTTNNLYVYMGTVGSFASGGGVYPDETTSIEVGPGVVLPLLIENRLVNLKHPDGAARLTTMVMAASTAKTALFNVTLSRSIFDFSDAESVSGGLPTLER